MKKNLIPLVLLLGWGATAQEKVVVNTGNVYVSPGTQVLIDSPFENKKDASLKNGGELHLKNSFTNDGLLLTVPLSSEKNEGTLFLTQEKEKQIVQGAGMFEINDVVFNNQGTTVKGDVEIGGKSRFENGIVVVDGKDLALTYKGKGSVEEVSDKSHVEGIVERIGNNELTLPIGDQGIYRPAFFGNTNSKNSKFTGKYVKANPLALHAHDVKRSEIELIDDKEYWLIEAGANNKDGLLLALSWDEKVTPTEVLIDKDEKLSIVRWDDVQKKWVNEGGVIEKDAKLVRIPVDVKDFGIFTLARVDKKFIEDDSVKIYNAVSPNGDGKNDYFILENINLHKDNTVRIYNRWGVKVFETNNYDPNGDGSINVFNGTATGKGVLGNGKLPSGTYYYDLRYVKTDNKGSETIKKAGYLHLEND